MIRPRIAPGPACGFCSGRYHLLPWVTCVSERPAPSQPRQACFPISGGHRRRSHLGHAVVSQLKHSLEVLAFSVVSSSRKAENLFLLGALVPHLSPQVTEHLVVHLSSSVPPFRWSTPLPLTVRPLCVPPSVKMSQP